MNQYELLYIIPAKYTEAEIDTISEKISGIVTTAGAKVLETHQLGKRKLAYPINNVRNGNYVMSFIEADAEALTKLDQVLRLSTDLLRHIIVDRNPLLTEIPSLIEVEEPRSMDRRRDGRGGVERKVMQQAKPVAPQGEAKDLDEKIEKVLNEEVL